MTSPRFGRTSVAAIAALALGLTACGSSTETTPDTTANTTAKTTAKTTANTTADTATEASADSAADTTVAAETTDGLQRYPDIVDANASSSDGTWTVDVTVSSPYDSPERYADGWRILGPDGTEYGFRELTHDHAGEQPFTRSLSGVIIPDGVDTVTIEGRDQHYGFGGETFELTLPNS